MGALNDFVQYLKSKGAPPAAGPTAQGEPAAAGDQAAPSAAPPPPSAGPAPSDAPSPPSAGPSAGPKPVDKRELSQAVTKRLNNLLGPYQLALDQKGPESARLQEMYKSLREALDTDDDERAAKILDDMEPFTVVLAKKTLVEKKVAALEKLPHADQFKQDIATIRTNIANAMKLTAAPGNDFKGAVVALKQVEASFATIQDLDKQYQRLLNVKADTDTKIARLDKHPQKKLIAADLEAIKKDEAAALALAEPPKHDYPQAIKALGAVDQRCAAAEVSILDAMTKSMQSNRAALEAYLKHTFKERFDVDLDLDDKGDSPQEVYEAVKKIYELMAEVPESHTNRNPSLDEVKRIGGPEGKGDDTWYQPGTKFAGITWAGDKMNIHAGRPNNTNFDPSQRGLLDATGKANPPVDPACEPTSSASHNRFNWGTLHEIGHAADDRQGFMKQSKNLGYAGWIDYGSDNTPVARAAAAHFKIPGGDDMLDYIKDILKGKSKSRPKAPKSMTDKDFGDAMQQVEIWCASVRVTKNPWDNQPAPLDGGRMYHEAYEGQWVSYNRAARSQGISGYQFRAPAEWFAELYAAYHTGILKDEHPMVKNFLLDM